MPVQSSIASPFKESCCIAIIQEAQVNRHCADV